MNSSPITLQVSDRAPDKDHLQSWVERTCHPVLKALRELANGLAQNTVQAVTATGTLNPGTDLALVDATAGPVTVTLAAPKVWERRILVIKTDATVNTVTVSGGVIPLSITGQYGVVEVSCDGVQYYPTGTSALSGDVTGAATANLVSKLQGILLTIGTPNTGDVLMYDGTQITPTPLAIRALDATYAPVGCWLMNAGGSTATDISGNGNNLTAEAGTVRASRVWAGPGGAGFLFDGALKMSPGGIKAVLQQLGAMTFLFVGFWSDLPTGGTSRTVVSCGAAGETSDTNYAYTMSIDANNQHTYFSEHGAGVNDTGSVNTFAPRGVLGLWGFTRDGGGVLTSWQCSVAVTPSMGTVTLPTDASNTTFRIGGDDGASNFFTGCIQSAALYSTALNQAQMTERYNFTLGRVCGFR